jgi:hypothetical protein
VGRQTQGVWFAGGLELLDVGSWIDYDMPCYQPQSNYVMKFIRISAFTRVTISEIGRRLRMRFPSLLAAVVLTVSFAFGQANECETAKPSGIRTLDGVVVQRVVLQGNWGRTDATVLLPSDEIVKAAIVFSHSKIHPHGEAPTDLLPMALTLARAGAAIIVPNRSLEWPPNDSSTNREGAVVECAAHWIVKNTKVPNAGMPITNREGGVTHWVYGYVGPRVCKSTASPDCELSNPLLTDGYHSATIPVGEPENGSTKSILSDGGLRAAQSLQRHLGLRRIDKIEQASASAAL